MQATALPEPGAPDAFRTGASPCAWQVSGAAQLSR